MHTKIFVDDLYDNLCIKDGQLDQTTALGLSNNL